MKTYGKKWFFALTLAALAMIAIASLWVVIGQMFIEFYYSVVSSRRFEISNIDFWKSIKSGVVVGFITGVSCCFLYYRKSRRR